MWDNITIVMVAIVVIIGAIGLFIGGCLIAKAIIEEELY
jgi:uncharacterized protein YneF (UPF0154 family)